MYLGKYCGGCQFLHMAKSCFGLYYEHKSKGRTVKKMVKMLQGGRTAAPARTRAEKRARGRQRRRRVLTKLNQSKSLYLFLIPAIVYFIIFCYLPMYGVQIAFKYYSPRLGIWGSTWTGMENLNRFFDSYYFWRLLRNTVGLSLYNLIVAFPFPILLALVFNEVKSPKLKKAVQTISYAPHFISVVVLVGILNLFFNQGNGLINVFLDKMGFEKFGFLTSSAAFPSMYVWSGVWQNAGWNSIIYIAALAAIDPQLHEAAQIDGAGTLRCFIHVVLPVCQPILGAAVALSFADCWNLVEQPLTYLTTRTELYPLSVVFNQLTQQSTGVEFAGAALYTLPALLIYLYFQNDILEGVQLTELK